MNIKKKVQQEIKRASTRGLEQREREVKEADEAISATVDITYAPHSYVPEGENAKEVETYRAQEFASSGQGSAYARRREQQDKRLRQAMRARERQRRVANDEPAVPGSERPSEIRRRARKQNARRKS